MTLPSFNVQSQLSASIPATSSECERAGDIRLFLADGHIISGCLTPLSPLMLQSCCTATLKVRARRGAIIW